MSRVLGTEYLSTQYHLRLGTLAQYDAHNLSTDAQESRDGTTATFNPPPVPAIRRRGGGAAGRTGKNRCCEADDWRKAKSVILIFNCGAPSHIDLWDMKPEASDTVRGEFKPIATNVPGIQISELMPRLAERTDKLAIVRSLHHTQSSHNSGMYYSVVGRPYRIDSTLINPSPTDYPCFGTLVGWLAQRDGYTGAVPPYVITPEPHCDSKVYITPGQYGGCLGSKYDPFVLNADPNAADFKVRNLRLNDELSTERLGERSKLLGKLSTATLAGFRRKRQPSMTRSAKKPRQLSLPATRLARSTCQRSRRRSASGMGGTRGANRICSRDG